LLQNREEFEPNPLKPDRREGSVERTPIIPAIVPTMPGRLVAVSLTVAACTTGAPRATPAPEDAEVAPAPLSSGPALVASSGPEGGSAAPSGALVPPAPLDPLATGPATLLSLATKGEPPPGVPAAPYAALFEVGRRWKLSGTKKHGGTRDDGSPLETSRAFSASCEVAEVERYVWGLRARTACRDLPQIAAEDLVLGHWFALPEGLYFRRELGTGGALALAPTDRLFPMPLEAASREEREEEGFLSTWRTFQEGGAWCYEQVTAAGDEAWHRVCVAEKVGLVSGSYGWAGGSSDEVEFRAK
jgi:hypothetical protein